MRRPFGILLSLALVACRPPGGDAAQTKASVPIHVQTAPIAERPMPDTITLTGTLRGNQESDVAADTSGKVVQTLVERGQPVAKGQVIATLDARGAALGATAAEAQAKVAQNQLEEAQRECERVKHLLETKAISQAEYDRQTTECTSRQWGAAAAQAQQQTATKLLGDTRVRAPFDGIVGERFVNVGQYVGPNTKVASVYEPDPVRLQLTVPEAELGLVKQDLIVTFTVAAYGDEKFKGIVKFISPNVRESTRDLVIEAIVTNPERKLRPGMFAVAKVPLAERTLPVVPTTAVVRDETNARVFVVVSQLVQERVVQLGETQGDVIAVVGGVKAGESLVLTPAADVHDGAKVE